MKSQKQPMSYIMQDRRVNHMLERHSVRAESETSATYFAQGNIVKDVQYENNLFSSSLSELFSRNLRLLPNNVVYGHSVDNVSAHYEEGEPFESLEEIEAQTIGNLLPKDEDLFSAVTEGLDYLIQSNGGDEMEELDLFSSVGGMDLGDDVSSTGKSDWKFPGGASNGQPGICDTSLDAEPPSRTLFVRNINSNVEDTELRILFEQYGDIHTLYTACKHRGFVMISYYDIRAARNAMNALHNRPLRQRNLDIHYSIPKNNYSEKDINQGTIVVFNLDSSVLNDELRKIFGVYGEIKEIRETQNGSQRKCIEFYDIRAAEAAFHALNRSNIAGNRIKLEPSHPVDECHPYLQQNNPSNSTTGFSGINANHMSCSLNIDLGENRIFMLAHKALVTGSILHGAIASNSSDNRATLGTHSATHVPITPFIFHHGISSSVPNRLPSLMKVESVCNQSSLAEPDHSPGHVNFDILGAPSFHPHSLPEYHEGLISCNSPGKVAANFSTRLPETIDNGQLCRIRSNGHTAEDTDGVFGSSGNGSCPPPGLHYTWSNAYCPQPPGMVWQHSRLPSLIDGNSAAHSPSRLHGPPRPPSRMMNTFLPTNHHHVGSAPTSANPSIWDRWPSYNGESLEASGFHPGSIRNMRLSNNSSRSMEFVSHNIFPHAGGSYLDMPILPKNAIQSHHQKGMIFPGRSQMIPMMNTFDSPNEHARSRRSEGSSSQTDNKQQYELDVDRIKRGEDKRTTLMIKNIPNKYTSKMLLAAIDERHRGTYDFIYLPIDFKNKCNVGYAFINITDPSHIIPLYQTFNGKKWEKFNSEKVASLAYARIQGKAALVAHFQNSSLMNEDKRCRPILFNTNGPNAGDQVPFPMGVNIRTRPEKARTNTSEENQQTSPPNSVNGNDSSNGKESD